MRVITVTCDVCGTDKPNPRWMKYWFPSTIAGGGAGNGFDELCWQCYSDICTKTGKIWTAFELKRRRRMERKK